MTDLEAAKLIIVELYRRWGWLVVDAQRRVDTSDMPGAYSDELKDAIELKELLEN